MSEPLTLTLPDGSARVTARARRRSGGAFDRPATGGRDRRLDGQTVDRGAARARQGVSRLHGQNPKRGSHPPLAEHVLADAVTRLWPEALYDAGRQDPADISRLSLSAPSPPRT
jgi:hypothetical protein